jgi:glucose/arabinose dehydrogenase/mono/diheme cytochrome c family protein
MQISCRRRWASQGGAIVLVVFAIFACGRRDAPIAPVLGPTTDVPVRGPNPLEPTSSRPDNPTCLAPERPRAAVELTRVFENLELAAPVGLVQAPKLPGDSDGRWFLIEQAGHVRSFLASGEQTATDIVASDLTARVAAPAGLDERGLLGIALHPTFPEDPRVFLMFTTAENGLSEQISSFVVDGGSIDSSSEVPLITIADPFSNHNGGALAFGPDGALYIGIGDGGDGGDPLGHGQDKDTLLGSILRIDIDATTGGLPYGIPADNPFASGGGAPEIYAYGLRNPWRFSFDRDLGTLWVGDVGQNAWEEVTIVERGENHGWNVWEGNVCFESSDCPSAGFTPPVHVYENPPGNDSRSVTGGYVYRGAEIPDLVGSYVFGDFVTGEIWRLTPSDDGYAHSALLRAGFNVSSFAESQDGELFALDYGGAVYRFRRGDTGESSSLVPLLSQTGCVNPNKPTEVTSAAVPYDVALPFWSDGATKERYLALPNGTQLTVDDQGDLMLPPSGVTLKNFRLDGRLIETRLYVRHADGEHSGYSYAWRDDESDADLVLETMTKQFGDVTWTYPGRDQCNACHTAAAGRSLGLELAQLDIENSVVRVNQLDALRRLDMLESERRAATNFQLEDASLEQQARAYLHVNCSNCHRLGGPGRGGLDLRFDTSLADSGLCDSATLGPLSTRSGALIEAGSPENSVVYVRANSRGKDGMPPLASGVVDGDGMSLLSRYIESLDGCP